MTRAITSDELTKLRSHGQFTELFLAVQTPATVFAARINQTFTTLDDLDQIVFDTVTTGAYTDILPGMTLYVGSSAGGYDLGMVRVRKAATSTVLYIGRTSDVVFADNAYLTVVNEFNLWAKHWRTLSSGLVQMDSDIDYAAQNSICDPVPLLGPDAVLWLTGATVTFSPSAAGSWVLGSTISGYSWAAPGASVTANLNTATPTITYNAAGTYRVACTVTAASGASFTGYRYVFVYTSSSLPYKPVVSNCSGNWGEGGWSFTVTLYDATLANIRDRAKCILFSKDYYAGAKSEIGPVTGYENIVASGWIDGESIEWHPEQGAVQFTVHGPQFWLANITAMPTTMKNVTTTPTVWTSYQTLVVDAAVWNLVHWRSTIDAVMDVFKSSDTRNAFQLDSPAGTLWSQLLYMTERRILAHPACNRYGQLYIQVDTQYLQLADRSGIPTVQAITKPDWTDQVRIDRKTVPPVGVLNTSGVDLSSPYLARAPGTVVQHYGQNENRDSLLVASQTDLNQITGMILAQKNNPYPTVGITLGQINRMIDLCPRQYVTLSIDAADTPRGITWVNQKLLPRRVDYQVDGQSGAVTVGLECEGETSGPAGITVYPSGTGKINIIGGGGTPPFGGGVFTPPWPPYIGTPPPVTPPTLPPSNACLAADLPTGPYNMWMGGTWLGNDLYYDGAYNRFPSTVRASTSGNKSQLEINGNFYKKVGGVWVETLEYGQFEVTATDEATGTEITAVNQAATTSRQRTAIFSPGSNTAVNLYQIASVSGGYTAPVLSNLAFWFNGFYTDPVFTDMGTGLPVTIESGPYETRFIRTGITQETAPNGSIHVACAYSYTIQGGKYVYDLWSRHDLYIEPGIAFDVPDLTKLRAKMQVTITAVPSGGGSISWANGPEIHSMSSYYWLNETGYVNPTKTANYAAGEFTFTPSGQYATEVMVALNQFYCYNAAYGGTISGEIIIEAWISYDDAAEYQASIDSVYLRNVCPA